MPSQHYVGVEVAREAAEFYYSQQHIIAKFQTLRETLTRDIFHLGVKPYMHIQTLHVRINNDKISDCLVTKAGADGHGRLIENAAMEQSVAQEKRNLNDLYQKLEAGFALLQAKREPSSLKLCIIIKMSGYNDDYYEETQEDVTSRRDYERRFMNVLETIRKPVYDMIHAGCNVEVKFEPELDEGYEDRYWGDGTDGGIESDSDEDTDVYMRLNLTPALFHLSKEEWEKVRSSPRRTPPLSRRLYQTTLPKHFYKSHTNTHPLPGKSHKHLPPRPLQPKSTLQIPHPPPLHPHQQTLPNGLRPQPGRVQSEMGLYITREAVTCWKIYLWAGRCR
ncbi:uncharacterized protein J4E84_010187 [Alternaria hordeiaustralica]|uniref:uncharacterized protein n=1 Tax=Alternaria hordeiaustralica TaxID=1187925 RepID=UPI0020C4D3EE|nr:uncharacterized protein J4E84_010187 [Alternaria hordeiaustralica]KAI4675295.1 hypothetical protein J4E84_010187 [Alternaria hordeiaustralica]